MARQVSPRQGMVRIDVQGIEDTLLAVGSVPKGIDRARRRALAKLATYGQREVARMVASAVGTTQKRIAALARVSTRKRADGSIEFWIGTNPIGAQYLGAVSWKRSWKGAKAGRHQFPGSWSWVGKSGAKTGAAIMRRTGGTYTTFRGRSTADWARGNAVLAQYGLAPVNMGRGGTTREGIGEVTVPIHPLIAPRLGALQDLLARRFEVLMLQELNYALKVEARAA